MITPHHPPAASAVKGMTVGEIASKLYPDGQCDYSLPQNWVDECLQAGFNPCGKFVWLYHSGAVFGQPAPLTAEAARDIPAKMIGFAFFAAYLLPPTEDDHQADLDGMNLYDGQLAANWRPQ